MVGGGPTAFSGPVVRVRRRIGRPTVASVAEGWALVPRREAPVRPSAQVGEACFYSDRAARPGGAHAAEWDVGKARRVGPGTRTNGASARAGARAGTGRGKRAGAGPGVGSRRGVGWGRQEGAAEPTPEGRRRGVEWGGRGVRPPAQAHRPPAASAPRAASRASPALAAVSGSPREAARLRRQDRVTARSHGGIW